ncbi:MAG TPA: hypothetical protein PLQ76_05965 [bacterium]|nr:hypothetical protein [bacterium]
MKIIIDGEPKSWEFDQDLTLSDVIVEINEKLLVKEKRVVTKIQIDDDDMEENLKKLTPEQVTLDRIKQISFETEPFLKNLSNEIKNCSEIIQSVLDTIGNIINKLMTGEVDVAMTTLKESIDKLIWVFNLLIQASAIEAIRIDEVELGEGSLKDFMGRFKSTLEELSQAMENNDTTLINDFLEYEFEPALKELQSVIGPISEAVGKFEFED